MDPGVDKSGIFDLQCLELFLDEHQKGKDYGEAIWALIVFELWRRHYIEN